MRIAECEIPIPKIRNSFRRTRCTEVKTQNSVFRSDATPTRRTQRGIAATTEGDRIGLSEYGRVGVSA